MKFFVLGVLFANFILVYCERARYDNYRVYSIDIENEKQLKVMKDLETFPGGVRFIDTPIAVGQTLELVVPPHKFADISEIIKTTKLKSNIRSKNLQR